MQEESEKKHDNQFLKKKKRLRMELKKHKKYQIQLTPTFKIYGRVHGVNVVGIKGRQKKTMNQNS